MLAWLGSEVLWDSAGAITEQLTRVPLPLGSWRPAGLSLPTTSLLPPRLSLFNFSKAHDPAGKSPELCALYYVVTCPALVYLSWYLAPGI